MDTYIKDIYIDTGNVHTFKYIGVKLPPNSTKFAPTVDR